MRDAVPLNLLSIFYLQVLCQISKLLNKLNMEMMLMAMIGSGST